MKGWRTLQKALLVKIQKTTGHGVPSPNWHEMYSMMHTLRLKKRPEKGAVKILRLGTRKSAVRLYFLELTGKLHPSLSKTVT